MKNKTLIVIFTVFVMIAFGFAMRTALNYFTTNKILGKDVTSNININIKPKDFSIPPIENPTSDLEMLFGNGDMVIRIPRIDTIQTKRKQNMHLYIEFQNGSKLTLFEDTVKFEVASIAQKLISKKNIFVVDADGNKLNSEYEVLKYAFNKTSSDLNYYKGTNQLMSMIFLLKLKTIYQMRGVEKGWSNFDMTECNGFQYCDPSNCDEVTIQLFSKNKKYVVVSSKLNQEEINTFLRFSEWE